MTLKEKFEASRAQNAARVAQLVANGTFENEVDYREATIAALKSNDSEALSALFGTEVVVIDYTK